MNSRNIRHEERGDLAQDLYELVSLTVHTGNLAMGHYVAFSKRMDGEWYLFNDDQYFKVTEKEVLSQEAYLLFYKKVDDS